MPLRALNHALAQVPPALAPPGAIWKVARKLLEDAPPAEAAAAAARVVEAVCASLRGAVPRQRKALRRELHQELVGWALRA